MGFLPVFPKKPATSAMIKHSIYVSMRGTQFLKPGKTPVLGVDQPLYAIAKQLQCSFPDSVGKDELVVRMEALHIEDKVHETIGVLLRDS